MTRLTAVIPTYNRRATLEKTLSASLAVSDGMPIDFVVVDDGSRDDTAEFLKKLAKNDGRLRYKSVANSGPGSARNVGAAMATGDIILFMGDDATPVSRQFFDTHIRMHEKDPQKTTAVLGKVVWPAEPSFPVSFTMAMIQGEGGQQFGYAHMRPYARYDWRFFYTANVSIKRSVIDAWDVDGFSKAFTTYGYEDGEFAYRLQKKLGRLDVLYAPTALAEHYHKYDVSGFLNRQIGAGMMATVFAALHPEVTDKLGINQLLLCAKQASSLQEQLSQADLVSVVEGIFASARLLDAGGRLGTSAWHTSFINAVFELAYAKGAISALSDPSENRAAAYRHAIDLFESRLHLALEHECIPATLPYAYAKKK